MKKILIGLLALGSVSAFAECNIETLTIYNIGLTSEEQVVNALNEKGYTFSSWPKSTYAGQVTVLSNGADDGYVITLGTTTSYTKHLFNRVTTNHRKVVSVKTPSGNYYSKSKSIRTYTSSLDWEFRHLPDCGDI
jgi:hypothetical protein